MNTNPTSARGFTLIELMIAVAILALLSAIAMPAYRNYISTSEDGVLVSNIATIEIFQEDVFLRTGAYANNLPSLSAITAATNWAPQASDGITYAIANSTGVFYQITATATNGRSVCMRYPQKTRC